MYFIQVFCAVLAFVSYAASKGYSSYGMGASGYGGYGATGSYGGGSGAHGAGFGHYGNEMQSFVPKPYGFGYEAPDEMGNSHFREEQGDASGNIKGSYGYVDNQGLYRKVEYTANAGGFTANIKTNEPGNDGKEDPADVSLYAQSPPAGIQEKYTQSSGYGMGGFGAGGKYGGSGGFGSGMNTGFYGAAKNIGFGGLGSGMGAGAYSMEGGFGSGMSTSAHGMGGGLGASSYGMGGGNFKGLGGARSGSSSGYGSGGLGAAGKMGGFGGSNLFSGIQRSSSGKSGY